MYKTEQKMNYVLHVHGIDKFLIMLTCCLLTFSLFVVSYLRKK